MYYIDIKEPFSQKVVLKLDGNILMSIPSNEENSDYQKYLAWVAEGNEATEWNPEETE